MAGNALSVIGDSTTTGPATGPTGPTNPVDPTSPPATTGSAGAILGAAPSVGTPMALARPPSTLEASPLLAAAVLWC